MFTKDGYLTATDVLNVLARYLCTPERRMCKVSDDEFWAILHDDFWAFARKQQCCYLIASNGEVFRGSKQLLWSSDSTTPEGHFFNAQFGILGHHAPLSLPRGWKMLFFPVILLDQLMVRLSRQKTDRLYCGDLIGSSVCFTEEQVNTYVRAKAPGGEPALGLSEGAPNTVEDAAALLIEHLPTTERGAAAYIVRLCDEGRIGTKRQVEAVLVPKISKRAFDRAWATASKEHPYISSAGRRKARQSFDEARNHVLR
jgi:hypothetical protein